MEKVSRTQLILLGLVVILCLASKPVYAMPSSCFSEYAQFTTRAWNDYESCIQETNDSVWYVKIGVRQVCRASWISDAFQAEGSYVSCMANFSSLWK